VSSGGLFGRIRFHPIGIRCNGCAYSKVILPVVLAQLVGCDCQLHKFRPPHEVPTMRGEADYDQDG
jgi:hypothetical protein